MQMSSIFYDSALSYSGDTSISLRMGQYYTVAKRACLQTPFLFWNIRKLIRRHTRRRAVILSGFEISSRCKPRKLPKITSSCKKYIVFIFSVHFPFSTIQLQGLVTYYLPRHVQPCKLTSNIFQFPPGMLHANIAPILQHFVQCCKQILRPLQI